MLDIGVTLKLDKVYRLYIKKLEVSSLKKTRCHCRYLPAPGGGSGIASEMRSMAARLPKGQPRWWGLRSNLEMKAELLESRFVHTDRPSSLSEPFPPDPKCTLCNGSGYIYVDEQGYYKGSAPGE
jgi:hypothetical protein